MSDSATLNTHQLIACPSCDRLFDVSTLDDGDKARCTRCGHFLTAYRHQGFSHVQAYSVAGLVFLAIACLFPFMSFQSSGVESVMTLPQTALQLYQEGRPWLSLIVASFIITIPALVLVLLLMLSTALEYGYAHPKLWLLGRAIFTLQNWSMVEVFFIGVLVSLVKIAKMATIIIGISFWAYAAFCICFTLALANLDRFQSWRRIDELGHEHD